MISELAHIQVKPGMEQEFIEGVEKSRPLFMASKGCLSLALHHCIEVPTMFVVVVHWESLEDHMVTFRQSPAYQSWRQNVGHCFAKPPMVMHAQKVA